MFEFFKNKKNELTNLNELPSLGDFEKNQNNKFPDLPKLTNIGTENNSISGIGMEEQNNLNQNLNNNVQNINNNPQFINTIEQNLQTSEPGLSPMLNPNRLTPPETAINQQNMQTAIGTTENNNLELLKSQIETLNSKISLLIAKQQTIDSKLNIIYEILLEEISDETKRKLALKGYLNQ